MKKIIDNFIKDIQHNLKIKLFFALLFSISTLCTCLFINNSLTKQKLSLSFDLSQIRSITVDSILINDNQYINTYDYNDYLNDDGVYSFDIDEVSINCNKNDELFISIPKKMNDYLSILLDGESMDTEEVDDSVIYTRSVDKLDIIISNFRDLGISISILFVLGFVFLYLILLTFIDIFLIQIKKNEFHFLTFLFAISSLFIIFYWNFNILFCLTKFYFILIFGLIFIIWLYRIIINNNIEIHNIFLVVVSLLSIFFIFAIPPFNVPDEGIHFIKSYDHLFYLEKDRQPQSDLSINVHDFYNRNSNNVLVYNKKISNLSYFQEYANKINKNDFDNDQGAYGTYRMNKFAYIPSNLIIFICKIINTPVLIMFFLARFVNALIFVLLTYFAIKIVPKYKYALILVSTLPITIHQAIGINQDSINNSIFIFTVAYILNKIFSKEDFKLKDSIIIMLLILGLSLCKVVYTPIILLILFLENKKMKKPLLNKTLMVIVAIFLTLISYIGYSTIWNYLTNNVYNGSSSTSNYYTFDMIIKNPLNIIKMYIKTTRQYGLMHLFSGLYNGFGWSKIWINNLLVTFVSSTIYIILFITQPFEEKVDKKFKLGSLIISIILYLVVFTSLLLGWTDKSADIVCGLQPRYFIPVVTLIYIFINNNYFKYNGKNYNAFIMCLISFVNIIILMFITKYFYF